VTGQTRSVVFVSRSLSGESLRCAEAVAKLDGVRLLGVCEEVPTEKGSRAFADLIRIADPHDAGALISACRELADRHGVLSRIVTAHETLLEPAARAGEALGVAGLSVSTVRRALDKSELKSVLRGNGIETARDRLLSGAIEAKRFAGEVGFPIVLKPLNGSGGLATWCVQDRAHLDLAVTLMQPSVENPVLAEEYLRGEELCIDTITIKGEPRFYSICCYRPSILEALEDPAIQWRCIMPRDIEVMRYQKFIEKGLKAVRFLEVGDAMTHMEGFLLDNGGVRFIDATLRPAGARIGPMLAYAYDLDPYLAWARAAVDGRIDGPWERKYAAGTIFLRGPGDGLIEEVSGLDRVREQIGDLIVDARLPRAGAAKSPTYTGDGYITVRHRETGVVEEALGLIERTVSVDYSGPLASGEGRSPGDTWAERIQYFDKQLNKPAWDDDSVAGLSK
jgi:hypothetical protein